jgi:hypothetical protein
MEVLGHRAAVVVQKSHTSTVARVDVDVSGGAIVVIPARARCMSFTGNLGFLAA